MLAGLCMYSNAKITAQKGMAGSLPTTSSEGSAFSQDKLLEVNLWLSNCYIASTLFWKEQALHAARRNGMMMFQRILLLDGQHFKSKSPQFCGQEMVCQCVS